MSTTNQSSLTELDYSTVEKETPDEENIISDVTDADEFNTANVGDQFWIDGTVYTICGSQPRLVSVRPTNVVSEDGEQKVLKAGATSDRKHTGVACTSNIESGERVDKSDMMCTLDDVYKVGENKIAELHQLLPDSNTRTCGVCGKDTSDKLVRGELRATQVVEIRTCIGKGCEHTYRYVNEKQVNDTGELITRERDEQQLTVTDINGLFECEIQDDIKYLLYTNDGAFDGYYSASEVTEFCNERVLREKITELLRQDSFSVSELFDTLLFKETESTITGEVEHQFTEPKEIFTHVYDGVEPAEPLSSILEETQSFDILATVVMTLAELDLGPSDQNWRFKDKLELDISLETATRIIGNYIIENNCVTNTVTSDVVNTSDESDYITSVVSDVFESHSLSGREFLETTAFYQLLEKSENNDENVVTVKPPKEGYKNNTTTITWKDKPGFQKTYKNTYRKVREEPTEPFKISYKWLMDEFDITRFIS